MEAFVIDSATRDRLIAEDYNSQDLIKPFLGGKDLKKWHAQPRDLWLITIPKFWTTKAINKDSEEILSEEEAWLWLRKKYSAISNWLEPFAGKGRKRTDKGEFWWELRACAYYEKFEKPKVFYPDISDSPKFVLDTNKYFSETTLFFIPDADSYLLSLLNSKVMWFVIKAICPVIRGGYSRAKSIYMETLPIPPATAEQQTSIGNLAEKCQELSEKRYSIENNFRRRLLDLCPPEREVKLNNKLKSWWLLDFSDLQKQIKGQFKSTIPLAERNEWQDYFEAEKAKIAMLNQEISQLETDLNQEVYHLFDLTPQEILLVEA